MLVVDTAVGTKGPAIYIHRVSLPLAFMYWLVIEKLDPCGWWGFLGRWGYLLEARIWNRWYSDVHEHLHFNVSQEWADKNFGWDGPVKIYWPDEDDE